MIDLQQTFSDQLAQFTRFQKDAAEKLQARSTANIETWEKFARQNLAVMGDFVDYTVKQARVATTVTEPEEFFGKRIDNATEFAKVLEGRTKEYIDLWTASASAASEEIQEVTRKKVVKAVKKSA
jgi:glycerol-3-phosphate dehydrogenase